MVGARPNNEKAAKEQIAALRREVAALKKAQSRDSTLPTPPHTLTDSSIADWKSVPARNLKAHPTPSSYASSSVPSYRTPDPSTDGRGAHHQRHSRVPAARKASSTTAGQPTAATLRVRARIAEKPDHGLGVYRSLNVLLTGQITRNELRRALQDVGVDASSTDVAQVFSFYEEQDGSGKASAKRLLEGLQGEKRRPTTGRGDGAGQGSRGAATAAQSPRVDSNAEAVGGGNNAKGMSGSGRQAAEAARQVTGRREAWGDAAAAPAAPTAANAAAAVAIAAAATERDDSLAKPMADPLATVAALFYVPACGLEKFIERLQASQVTECATMASAAFAARVLHLRPALGRRTTAALAAAVEMPNEHRIDIEKLHSELMQRFGRPGRSGSASAGSVPAAGSGSGSGGGGGSVASAGGDAIDRVRRRLAAAGGSTGLQRLNRLIRSCDVDGNGLLNREELKAAMEAIGAPLTLKELEHVFTLLDRDRSGQLSLEELAQLVRGGEMPQRRAALVARAFDVLDASGDGRVTVDDLTDRFDVSSHPAVLAGVKTKEQALREFLASFEGAAGDGDGIVTREEFFGYYRDVSACVDGDDNFELMMNNAWHMNSADRTSYNTANLRCLVTRLDGTQAIETLHDDLGVKRGDSAEILRRLRRQGVDVVAVELLGGAAEQFKSQKHPAKENGYKGATASNGSSNGHRNLLQGERRRSSQSSLLLGRKRNASAAAAAAEDKARAAALLQKTFRGHQARALVSRLARQKRVAEQKQREEEEEERRRLAHRVLRPKVRGTHGF